jgi:hypothetical protein
MLFANNRAHLERLSYFTPVNGSEEVVVNVHREDTGIILFVQLL